MMRRVHRLDPRGVREGQVRVIVAAVAVRLGCSPTADGGDGRHSQLWRRWFGGAERERRGVPVTPVSTVRRGHQCPPKLLELS